jgi:hypothetical protein
MNSFHDRVQSLLGDQWRSRLALALLCTPQRFSRPPQPIIVAVLELVEFALVNGIAEQELPQRWTGRPTPADADLRTRFLHVLGGDRLTTTVARAVGVQKATVRLAWSDGRQSERCSTELLTIVELLELFQDKNIGRATWPARWREIPHVKPTRPRWASDTPTQIPGREMERRARAVLGDDRTSARLAHALSLSQSYVNGIWREARDSHGRPARAQQYLVAAVELLETLVAEGVPVERWPPRWRSSPERKNPGLPKDVAKRDCAELEEKISIS